MCDSEHDESGGLRAPSLSPRLCPRPPQSVPGRAAQKYWHKGAFFQEEGDAQVEDGPMLGALASRDFSAPTGQDKFDRSTLPKVMQVCPQGCADAAGVGEERAAASARVSEPLV